MLFMTIACTITTFDIKKAVDENENEVNPGILMYVVPSRLVEL